MIRLDDDDEVYRTAAEKYRAILALIDGCKTRGNLCWLHDLDRKSEQLARCCASWLEQHDFADPTRLPPLQRRRRRLEGEGVRHSQRPLP